MAKQRLENADIGSYVPRTMTNKKVLEQMEKQTTLKTKKTEMNLMLESMDKSHIYCLSDANKQLI